MRFQIAVFSASTAYTHGLGNQGNIYFPVQNHNRGSHVIMAEKHSLMLDLATKN